MNWHLTTLVNDVALLIGAAGNCLMPTHFPVAGLLQMSKSFKQVLMQRMLTSTFFSPSHEVKHSSAFDRHSSVGWATVSRGVFGVALSSALDGSVETAATKARLIRVIENFNIVSLPCTLEQQIVLSLVKRKK